MFANLGCRSNSYVITIKRFTVLVCLSLLKLQREKVTTAMIVDSRQILVVLRDEPFPTEMALPSF